jgi:tetratricopeptide (TPR) repeat protein
MCKNRFLLLMVMILSSVIVLSNSYAADKQDEIRKKIEELQRKKLEIQKLKDKENTAPSKNEGKSVDEIIARYERLLTSCNVKKSDRCADVEYTLGGLYYDQGRDGYIQAREDYEKRMDAYEKHPSGPEPVNPVPDYSKSLNMYQRLEQEYPDFPKLCDAYYQMGTIYMLMGDVDKTKYVFTKIIEKFPECPRSSGAHFRLADLAYLDHDNVSALKHLEAIKQNLIDIQSWEMVNYRKAELYYNTGEFDKAINLFYTYVENCDAGIYPKKEFREMALEFMAISFSDMGNGAQEALDFFKKVGNKPYQAYVLYTIGLKNRNHGQFDDAITALSTALKSFPFYKDAPVARQALIDCYVVKKEAEKANAERIRLVDDYGPNSEWYSKNSGQAAVIEQSRNEVKKALGNIAIYYHAIAQKKKDKSAYETALKRYNEFFTRFPDDKWKTYEYKYNVAEIYNSLGDCEKASENYNFVAMEDLTKYPEFKSDIDTLGMDQDDVEKAKKTADKGPVLISQEDAGYNVIVSLDNCRKKAMAKAGVSEEQAYNLPETKKLLDFTEKFQARFPKSANAADVLYLAGNIHYSAKSYENAIRVFKQVADNYATTKTGEKATRMLANSYSSSGQYELAMNIYNRLIAKTPSNSPDYAEVVDLAAGSMFKRAESMQKGGNFTAAAEAFKAISGQFADSKVADRGWFEAGVCYEEMKDTVTAAKTFEDLTIKFPKSTIREKAYLRAADDYKKMNQYDKAAQVYQTAANNITKAEFAIPSLSSASECYQKISQFDMAGKMFELIYDRYSNDPKTPLALYNAGLIFEKGKFYSNAIGVYDALSKKFPQSEYAAEAFFSIGLCYEKMGQNEDMANVFSQYAEKFASDRFKQVQALVKAGDAYFNMKKYDQAEKDYILATSVYEKFNKESDIDVASIAQAYFKLGEIYYQKFEQIKLVTRSEKEMKELIKTKTKALEDPAKWYAKSIELGVAEWTVKSTYMIGQGFVDMADAIANQTLFGSAEQKIASKIKILSSLEKYYQKAQEYFYKNIEWSHNENLKDEFVDKSIDKFMEMAYLKGNILEQVGLTFANAPVPPGLTPEERDAYKQLLEEKKLEAMDAALPKYEEGIQAAKDLGIAQNANLEKIKARIAEINPNSKALNVEIVEWVPTAKPKNETTTTNKTNIKTIIEPNTTNKTMPVSNDDEFDRAMRRIQNIMSMQIAVDEKIKQLNRIEMDAKRNIVLEEEKITELKGKRN